MNWYFHFLIVLMIQYKNLAVSEDRTNNSWCMENEREALLKFKQGLEDYYGVVSSWGKTSTDCCKWRGVKCSNRTRHVTALDLRYDYNYDFPSYAPLRGNISSSLLNLKQLAYLDLYGNSFYQIRIPNFIGSLYTLRYLNLQGNDFFGTVPNEIGNLTKLRSLSLGDIKVNNLDWLSNLRFLQKLDLENVDLGKMDWLTAINNLSSLSELYLYSCNLPGIIRSTNNSHIPLRIIHLRFNNFMSSLDYNWLLNFSNSLVEIDMSGNPFGGFIPPVIGNMKFLQTLSLPRCALSGDIPKSFLNLTRLQSINLAKNNFTQRLPEIFQTLIESRNSLRSMDLSSNKISSSLPDITIFPFLRELRLEQNKLHGSFSQSSGQSCLEFLDLSSNELNESLPEMTSFCHLSELRLANNKFKGRVPESIGRLSNLKRLSSSFNSLSLDFDSDSPPLFQLEILELANCSLGPNFPNWLQSQSNLTVLDISNAGIIDSIPFWFWDLSPKLLHLNLSANQIHGMLPDLTIKFVNIMVIDLQSNLLNGQIPLLPPTVRVLLLSRNNFSGSIFPLCQIATEELSYLDLSYNLLSGEIPDCWVHAERLQVLDLAYNNFSGEIPTTFGHKLQLSILNLRHNRFVGDFSLTRNCTSLGFIDMSENKLSGKVPALIGTDFPNLLVLNFRMNQLHGSIPQDICNLTGIQFLDLSLNNISGNIPRCFGKFFSLVQTSSSRAEFSIASGGYGIGNYTYNVEYVVGALVQWKGKVLEYKTTLGLLKCIDLSSNYLAGDIPIELAKLEGLISLNLSRNSLSGDIMGNISRMKMLEVLDLSKNQLTGEIPPGLGMLNFLSVLDLSNNNFSGKIPSSTQLQSFNVTSYYGNTQLCGLPLPMKCPGEEDISDVTTTGKYYKKEDEDTIMTTGFYISLVLGFVVAFWGFYGMLLIRNSWRYAYFNFVNKIIDLL